MLYGLDDPVPGRAMATYALQHLTFFLANAAILPIIAGGYLGLDSLELAGLVQRTFILSGLLSIFQAFWGHRFPIMEGPAGLWFGVLVTLAVAAPGLGKELSVLRTDLETGFIVAGLVCCILGAAGMVAKMTRLFSPMVNGVFLVLMALQLSPTVVRAMLGLTAANRVADGKSLLVFTITTALIIWISLRKSGGFQSVAVLAGAGVGWALAYLVGISPPISSHADRMSSLPGLFPWGQPTFDPGVTLTCVLAALLLFSNLVASILGLCAVTGEPLQQKMFNRGAFFTGVSDIFAGAGSTIGFIPYASAVGFTALTGVAARAPFVLGAACMILLGVIPSVGVFFAAMPPAVSNSVIFIVFCLVFSLGIKEFGKLDMSTREQYIVGISCVVGVGVMFLPQEVFSELPQVFRYLLLNGLVDGMLICILLEQVFLRKH